MRQERTIAVLVLVVLIELAVVALAGCASSSVPPMDGRPTPRVGSVQLVESSAAATVVQPQPPPGSCHARGSGVFSLPDPRCTPGALNPAVSQRNIGATICREGYTDTVRPPESVTEPEKRASLAAYGVAPLREFEYDHLVPLALAGAVNDPRNSWPEPGPSPNAKDRLEARLAELVCRRRMALADAQRLIAGNWVAAYHRYVSRRGAGMSEQPVATREHIRKALNAAELAGLTFVAFNHHVKGGL